MPVPWAAFAETPGETRRRAPVHQPPCAPPIQETTHTSSIAPTESFVGLVNSPAGFGPPPRT